ncbi:hypothetical protein KJ359_010615 [Pestalotiopsis sp. 9143b]|nr:hypothetical protein KJ359_010615 [Pestalotiopsis sp. 9143b]
MESLAHSATFAQPSLPASSSMQPQTDAYGPASGSKRQRRISSAPSLERLKLESPDLTSDFSNTSESMLSIQLITPNITPPEIAAYPVKPSRPQETLFPPTTPLLPRRRRPRKPRAKPQLSEEEEAAKREKFLERNRVAAGKCREKRKSWMTELEDAKLELEEHNTRLRAEHGALQVEFDQMRALLMQHASCGDARINKWIENEAKRFVLDAGEQYDSLLAASYGITAVAAGNDGGTSEYVLRDLDGAAAAPRRRAVSAAAYSMSPPPPPSMAVPRAVAGALTHDADGGPVMFNEPIYMVSSTPRVGNAVSLDDYLENVPRTYPAC